MVDMQWLMKMLCMDQNVNDSDGNRRAFYTVNKLRPRVEIQLTVFHLKAQNWFKFIITFKTSKLTLQSSEEILAKHIQKMHSPSNCTSYLKKYI